MVKAITFLTTSLCNLDCSFCFLHNKNITGVKKLNDDIMTSIKNGNYLNNVIKIFNLNHYDFSQIESISFWGGETLLYIDSLINLTTNILTIFPNITNWFISTNFFNKDMTKIVTLLKTIDNQLTHDCNFQLQLSIDGLDPKYTTAGHNVPKQIYEENLTNLIKLLNIQHFQYLHIYISTNSVLSPEVFLNELNTEEKIFKYINDFHIFLQKANDLIVNKNVFINNVFALPKCAVPYNMTPEERTKLLSIFKLFDNIKYKYWPNFASDLYLIDGVRTGILENTNLLLPNKECSALNQNLTFLPDGTIVRCSGSYMSNSDEIKDEVKKLEKFDDLTELNFESSINFNRLTSSIIDQQEFVWRDQEGIKNTVNSYRHFFFAECRELLDAHQISEKYTNLDLLYKHIGCLNSTLSCDKNNTSSTGNSFLPSVDTIKRYFDGLVDYSYGIIREKQYNDFNRK